MPLQLVGNYAQQDALSIFNDLGFEYRDPTDPGWLHVDRDTWVCLDDLLAVYVAENKRRNRTPLYRTPIALARGTSCFLINARHYQRGGRVVSCRPLWASPAAEELVGRPLNYRLRGNELYLPSQPSDTIPPAGEGA